MKRDTKPIQQLLASTRDNLKAVRSQVESGVGWEHVYQELRKQEQIFSGRLKDLQAWNRGEDEREAKEGEIQAQVDRAAKIEKAKAELLATPLEELRKIAAGVKVEIEIKPTTTIPEIVEAILKAAPENI